MDFGGLLDLDFGFGGGLPDIPQVPQGPMDPFGGMGSSGGGAQMDPYGGMGGGGFNMPEVPQFNWGGVGNTLGSIAKGALPFAQVGMAGLGAANTWRAIQQAADNQKYFRQAQQAQQQAVAPLSQFGEEQLKLAQGGQIPQAEQAKIDLWKQGAIQKARDYLARSGQGESSTMRNWEDWINQQAVAMQSDILNRMRSGGVAALGLAAGGSNQAAQTAGQNQAGIEQLIAQANQALMAMAGGTGRA